jgi:hypothetical protein
VLLVRLWGYCVLLVFSLCAGLCSLLLQKGGALVAVVDWLLGRCLGVVVCVGGVSV